ncbi:MAG TPA: hypothetical protein VNA20_15510 [Frankiaceae bacterium]|nr:hypothetical protein [Frankiaceae bacterium]
MTPHPALSVSLRGRVTATLGGLALLYVGTVAAFVAIEVLPTFLLVVPVHVGALRHALRTRVTALELTERHLVVQTLSRTVRLPLAEVCTNYPGARSLKVWHRAKRDRYRVYDTERTRALLDLLPR